MDVTRRTTTLPASGSAIPALRDGPVIVLPSGVRLQRESVNGIRVTDAQLQQAILGVLQLPLADQQLMARSGVVIELLPTVTLNGGKQLGATNVGQDFFGTWIPSSMKVTVGSSTEIARLGVDAIAETVQHEIGHVISVITRQDQSEEAAIRYAATH
ncbi:MAG: hypothetical protein JWN72_2370 [Thermoleophilia bacterium]|nr:hypothetical protein [Thermoleophilia bacterium]